MKPRPLIAVTVCLLMAAVALLPVQSFTPPATPVVLGEFLYTVPLSKEKSPREAAQEWYHEYLEPGINDSLFIPLFEMIRSNSITTYKPAYPFNVKCTAQEARESVMKMDSAQVEDPNDPGNFELVMVKNERQAYDVHSITFHEVWTYDAATLTLEKEVKGIIPNIDWGWSPGDAAIRPSVYIPFTNEPNVDAAINVSLTYRLANYGSVELPDDYRISLVSDPAIDARQVKVRNQLLADVRTKPADKNFTVYVGGFPFTTVADKAMKTTMTGTLPVANSLLFYESWEVNPRNRIFRKTVKGVVPQIEKQIKAEEGGTRYEYQSLAFIPFNKYLPAAPAAITSVSRISYDVNFRNPTSAYSGYVPVYPQMLPRDSVKLDSMAVDIAEHIRRYEVKAFGGENGTAWFDPYTNSSVELSREEVKKFFVYGDSVMVEDPEDPSEFKVEYREWEIKHDVNCGFRFYEEWVFYDSYSKFGKGVSYVGMNALLQDRYDESGTRAQCRYFYYNPRTPYELIFKPEYLVARNVISSVLLNENEFRPDEADDGHAIVRYNDSWQNNIDASQRYAMFQPMIGKIMQGEVKVKRSMESEAFMTPAEFSAMMNAVINTNKLQVAKGMEFAIFNQLFFYEDWYYNPATAQICKEVKAVTFAYRGPDVTQNEESYGRTSDVQPCFTLLVNQPK